jgi:hypothetical protein
VKVKFSNCRCTVNLAVGENDIDYHSLLFSACLLTMVGDTIGLLHVWLAYPCTVLSLRCLVVTNDPLAPIFVKSSDS